MNLEEKLKLVKEAQSFSYSPYSHFKVGAVLIFKDGSIVSGCNVENASYGLSNCAERTAIFKAVSMGKNLKEAVELLIIGESNRPVSPCGACRQVMAELLNKDTKITLFSQNGDVKETNVEELLPYSFNDEDLNGK